MDEAEILEVFLFCFIKGISFLLGGVVGGGQQNPKIQAVSLLQFGWKL